MPANAAFPSSDTPAASAIPLGVPSAADVPGHARRLIAGAVAYIAPQKNVSLAPEEAGGTVDAVLAGLELADLYRIAMGDPAAVQKVGQAIGDALDAVALRHVALLVLQVEDKHDAAVLDIVTAIVRTIALATASGPIIWPDIATAVADYYRAIPSPAARAAAPAEASHGD